MFRQPTHVDAHLTPMAEAVYAVTILGTEVALANFDDGRDPGYALPGIRHGPSASASVCVHFNHSEVNDMISIGRMMAAMGLIVVVAGCYEHTYTVGAGAPAGPVVYGEWQHHWLGGLIGERTHELGELCPSGNATIHDEQTFLNGLVTFLTSGIYTPTTVTIRCSTGQSAQLQLSRKEIVSIVTAPAFRERLETVLPGRLREVESGIEALEEDFADG